MSKLSPILRKATGLDSTLIDCVVEVRPDKEEYVLEQLKEMGIKVDNSLISQPVPGGDYYIPAWIPSNKLEQVAEISGVVMIYKNMPRAAGSCHEEAESSYFTINDPLLGEIKIPDVEIPKAAVINAIAPNPAALIGTLIYPFAGINPFMKIKIFPTSVTASILKDVSTRDGAGVTVAILDTGSPAAVPQFAGKVGTLEQYTLWPEPPLDFMGHGCIKKDCRITTSFCGTMTLEEFWNRVDSEVIHAKDGEFKRLNVRDFVNTEDRQTRILGVFRTSADQSIRIKTKDATIQTTTWHKLFTNLGELEAKDVLKLIEDGAEVSLLTEEGQYAEVKSAKLLDHHEKYFYDLTTEAQRYAVEGIVVHNSWCHDCVCGLTAPCPYGMMTGMAPAVERSIHVKVLNTFPGCGSTWQILKGIEIAVKREAKVISMSLGGPSQGTCISDPEAKVVNQLSDKGVIFSIAMGNSGPKLWTGGSPGIALKAVTVASVSIIDDFRPAWWSSRGPGGKFDSSNKKDFDKALSHYKDLAIKPDCSCTGGGRAEKNAKYDEIIWSGATGWFEGFYDGLKDTTCGMHGCLDKNSFIITTNCGLQRFEDFYNEFASKYEEEVLENGDRRIDIRNEKIFTIAFNPETMSFEKRQITHVWKLNEDTEIVKIKAESGVELKLTPWHKVYVYKNGKIERIRADELKVGDYIIGPIEVPDLDRFDVDEDLAYVAGVVVGDGSMCKNGDKVTITSTDKKFLERIHEILKKHNWDCSRKVNQKPVSEKHLGSKTVYRITGNYELRKLLEKYLEIPSGKKAKIVEVPPKIIKSRVSSIAAFLAGLLDSDGSISRDKRGRVIIYYNTCSEKLAKQIAAMLNLLGIGFYLLPRKQKSVSGKEITKYQISIKGSYNIKTFVDRLQKYSWKLQQKLSEINEYLATSKPVTKTVKNIRLLKIKKIEKEKYNDFFYDLTVEGLNNYIGGHQGLAVVSNTSQATPHVAGLIACLVSDGIVDKSDDIKKHLKETANDYVILDPLNMKDDRLYFDEYGKSIATGWGLFKLSRFKR